MPWADPADLAEQKRLLLPSAYARLHQNIWTAAEDRLVSPEDLAACVTLDGPQPADPRHRYVIGLDIGLKHDRTVLAVCHAENRVLEHPFGAIPSLSISSLPRIVLDRLQVLTGTPVNPVQLATVEDLAYQAATVYHAPIRLDPWQAIGLGQRLKARGVAVTEWPFTGTSVGRLAMTLHQLFREHRLALPDDAELLDELATVRLRESQPGVYRLDHDASGHDDRAVALGLAALALTERIEGARSRALSVAPSSLTATATPAPRWPRRRRWRWRLATALAGCLAGRCWCRVRPTIRSDVTACGDSLAKISRCNRTGRTGVGPTFRRP